MRHHRNPHLPLWEITTPPKTIRTSKLKLIQSNRKLRTRLKVKRGRKPRLRRGLKKEQVLRHP